MSFKNVCLHYNKITNNVDFLQILYMERYSQLFKPVVNARFLPFRIQQTHGKIIGCLEYIKFHQIKLVTYFHILN